MSCAEMSVVEKLAREVEVIIRWDLIDALVNLMKKLVEAKSESDSKEDRQKLYALGERVEKRAIELVQKKVDKIGGDWRDGSAGPTKLRRQRDFFRMLAKEASTAKMRQALWSAGNFVQGLLNQGSENLAESLLSSAENDLTYVNELLDKGEELRVADANLCGAKNVMQRIKESPHLWHVGLPRVAKKRNVSVDALYNCVMRRIEASEIILRNLVSRVEEERRQEREREYERALQLTAEEERLRREEQIEQAVQVIERRNKPAGRAARQFLENVKLKNAGAAWACLEEVRRHDGGVPPVLQQKYQRLAQETTKIREI